nr:Orf64 [uncultured bacterium]
MKLPRMMTLENITRGETQRRKKWQTANQHHGKIVLHVSIGVVHGRHQRFEIELSMAVTKTKENA